MKKLIFNLILLIFIISVILIATLLTIGVETNKFNKLISDKALLTKNINIKLDTIKFKIDPKEFSLFLETQNPEITYRDVLVPVQNIKAYVDFLSLLKSDPKIKKTSFVLAELDIIQLKKLSIMIKPSNFKSILNNKIKEGKLISEIEVFLTDQGSFENFIARGTLKDFKVELFSGLNFTKANMNFFADKNDILIKNIFGNLEDIKISDGDIKFDLENGIKLDSNFNSNINFDEKLFKKYSKFLNKYSFVNKIKSLKANLNNNITIELDKTYKVQDYNYSISGKIEKSKFELSESIKNNFITEEIKEIYLSDLQIKTIFETKNISLNGEGKYSFNNMDFLKINLENKFKDDLLNLKLDFEYGNSLVLDLINYKKPKNSIANLSFDLKKIKTI